MLVHVQMTTGMEMFPLSASHKLNCYTTCSVVVQRDWSGCYCRLPEREMCILNTGEKGAQTCSDGVGENEEGQGERLWRQQEG